MGLLERETHEVACIWTNEYLWMRLYYTSGLHMRLMTHMPSHVAVGIASTAYPITRQKDKSSTTTKNDQPLVSRGLLWMS